MPEESRRLLINEVLYLTRELRFSTHLIQSALEETERFNLVVNDPSFLTFLLLTSQGVERILKLSLSYESILENHKQKFIPKSYGHSISKLYSQFKVKSTNEISELCSQLFESSDLLSDIMNKFTALLENFSGSGRYYFSSKETREESRFGYYYDEHFIHLINGYQELKIYQRFQKNSKYKIALIYAIEEAKAIDSDYEKLVPGLFCRNIDKSPLTPFWEHDFFDLPILADSKFRISSRDFLLLYISPIVSMLEIQFVKIMERFNILYHFSEITRTIRHKSGNYIKKKHKKNETDIYSGTLL